MSEQDGEFSESTHTVPTSGISSSIPVPEPEDSPLTSAGDGRDPTTGRFVRGNRAGRGNPLARRVAQLRSELLKTSTRAKMRAGIEKLWAQFAEGDCASARLILGYCLGPPEALDLIRQVETLRATIVRGVTSEFDAEDDQ